MAVEVFNKIPNVFGVVLFASGILVFIFLIWKRHDKK